MLLHYRCLLTLALAALINFQSTTAQPPPSPADSSTFLGNVNELLRFNPLALEEQSATLPLGVSSQFSAALIQLREGVAAHFHAERDEIVYVLRGKGVMTVGAQTEVVQAGDVILIRQGIAHEVVNRSADPLVALSIISPPFDGKDRIFSKNKTE